MRTYFSIALAGMVLGVLFCFAAGCALAPTSPATPASNPATGRSITGRVFGGQQPVVDASISLYAVGQTGDGSAATSLLTTPVMTDGSGYFSLTGLYMCPDATPNFPGQVYLVAAGGNPGLGQGKSNPQIVVMAALASAASYNRRPQSKSTK